MIERARERRQGSGRPTVLFLDEIHRFNKSQQDALLPAVEEGLLTLIGATTENPYFEVNSALLSALPDIRASVAGAETVGGAAAPRSVRSRGGLGRRRTVEDAALAILAHRSGGERGSRSRRWSGRSSGPEARASDVAAIEDALQRKALNYDRSGRSPLRLRLGLDQGDPRLRRRRLPLLPGGDVGGGRRPSLHRPPHGHPRLRGRRQRRSAGIADRRRRRLGRSIGSGLPECALNLAQARCLPGAAARSRTPPTRRSGAARAEVRENGAKTPPDYLRDAHYPGAHKLGRGEGYSYAHDGPDGAQRPAADAGTSWKIAVSTTPNDRGYETEIGERSAEVRKRFSIS